MKWRFRMLGSGSRGTHGQAFTLIELLVSIAVIGVLAGILLPALSRARNSALTVVCLNNQRQMACAWIMYTMEEDGALPPNYGYLGPRIPPSEPTWVYGWLENDSQINWRDNTNTAHLKNSLLGPYLKRSVGVWRCPADTSRFLFGGQNLPRVRSYAMNNFLNSVDHGPKDPWRMARRTAELVNPSPSETFVIIDEREDSIEDGYFVVDMYNAGPALASLPQSGHNTGGTLGFADGHSERKRWIDPRTTPPKKERGHIGIFSVGGPNPDVLWLRQYTTGKKR